MIKLLPWLVEKRVVDFLLALIELFSLALTVEAIYERILVDTVVFERGAGRFKCKFQGEWGRPPTNLASEN